MSSIKTNLVKRFPFLLSLKGWKVAWRDHFTGIRNSYSQAGEDQIIESLISDIDPENAIYVDVGANHPTRLSNTYRLYRKGWRGIIVEPNQILLKMHRRIRPRDEQLGIGCGDKPCVLRFQHAISHVLSGFAEGAMKTNEIRRAELMPVLTVDQILALYSDKTIALLSIDVEGFDLEVAKGAMETLKRTRVVCIEGSGEDENLMAFFRENAFQLHTNTRHNLIFTKIKV
jgi:FkbM family methyltransferase